MNKIKTRNLDEIVKEMLELTKDMPNLQKAIAQGKMFANVIYLSDNSPVLIVDYDKPFVLPYNQQLTIQYTQDAWNELQIHNYLRQHKGDGNIIN